MNCKHCHRQFANLLLDPAAGAHTRAARQHLAVCSTCSAELDQLRRSMALLDEWSAPEPSPYFDIRLKARLRESAAAQPAGLWERLRASLRYSYNLHLRPVVAVATLVVLSVGGFSSYTAISNRSVPQASSTVQELQTLDRNEQTINQMMQMLDDGNDDTGGQNSNAQVNP